MYDVSDVHIIYVITHIGVRFRLQATYLLLTIIGNNVLVVFRAVIAKWLDGFYNAELLKIAVSRNNKTLPSFPLTHRTAYTQQCLHQHLYTSVDISQRVQQVIYVTCRVWPIVKLSKITSLCKNEFCVGRYVCVLFVTTDCPIVLGTIRVSATCQVCINRRTKHH